MFGVYVLHNADSDISMPLAVVHAVGVISIDFGTEWLKIGIVKRGVAADIVLNAESKRKTPAALLLSESERLFGNSAKTAVCSSWLPQPALLRHGKLQIARLLKRQINAKADEYPF